MKKKVEKVLRDARADDTLTMKARYTLVRDALIADGVAKAEAAQVARWFTVLKVGDIIMMRQRIPSLPSLAAEIGECVRWTEGC